MPTNGLLERLSTAKQDFLCDDRPFVTLSFAQSLDGSLGQKVGSRSFISGKESVILTHQLRAAHEGILVGRNTLEVDNPSLTVRYTPGRSPQRIILSSKLDFKSDLKIFSDQDLCPWIITSDGTDQQKRQPLEELGCSIIAVPNHPDGLCLKQALKEIRARGIRSVMVEGGARVIESFLGLGLVDFAVITVAPVFFGAEGAVRYRSTEFALEYSCSETYGLDTVIWGLPKSTQEKIHGQPVRHFHQPG